MEGRLDIETSHRPCGRISRSLAFAAMRKGEARMRRSKGPKPLRRTPLFDSPARRETPTVLIPSNRRIRTRMSGGVGGEEPRGSPLSRSLTRSGHAEKTLPHFLGISSLLRPPEVADENRKQERREKSDVRQKQLFPKNRLSGFKKNKREGVRKDLS